MKCIICTIHGHYYKCSKQKLGFILADSDKLDGLRVSQMPRSPRVAIFMLAMTTTTDIQTDYFIMHS